ncbi:4Fe-4S binding protein [Candidatus Omnitrophota bacterium]
MAVRVNKIKCDGCGACADVCPANAIEIKQSKVVVSDECVECGACVDECPNEAISLPK